MITSPTGRRAVLVALAVAVLASLATVAGADPRPDCANASHEFRVNSTVDRDTRVRWCSDSADAAFGRGTVAFAEIGGGTAGDDVILYEGGAEFISYRTLLHELGHTSVQGYGHDWDSVMAVGNPEDRRSASIHRETWTIAAQYEGYRTVDWSGPNATAHLRRFACEFRRGHLSVAGMRYVVLQYREGTDRDVYFAGGFDRWGGFADRNPGLLAGRYTFYGKPAARDREWAGPFHRVDRPRLDRVPTAPGSPPGTVLRVGDAPVAAAVCGR